MAVSFGCPLVGTIGELETRVLKIGQRAYATNATYEDLHPEQEDGKIVSFTPWKTGDGSTAFKDLPWDKNMSGDDDANFKTAFRYIKTYDTLQDFEILPKDNIKIGDTFVIKTGGEISKTYTYDYPDFPTESFIVSSDEKVYLEQGEKFLPGSIFKLYNREIEFRLKTLEEFIYKDALEIEKKTFGWTLEFLSSSKLEPSDIGVGSMSIPIERYSPPTIICKDGDMLSWVGDGIGWKILGSTMENEAEVESIKNKSTIIDDNADDTKYPTTKAVKTFVESKIGSGGNVNLDNYYTKEETQALISDELDKLPIEDGKENYSAVQKTDLIAWETNSFDSFQDTEEIKNIESIKFDDTKENILIGAYGKNSISLGGKSQAVGSRSLVEGSKNISIGDNSHAEGELNIVIGGDSHGEGIGNFIEAHNAHGEGNGNKIGVGGNNAHAEGYHNEVDADSAHVEGSNNEAHGAASHVGGVDSKTTFEAGTAFAHGQGVIANRGTQIVLGSYNKEDNTKVFILGNGADNDHRNNIFTIDDNGNAVFAGDLEVNGASVVKDFQLADYCTKQEINSKISTVYKPCGTVSDLGELLDVSDKSVGDVYNIKTGGSVSTYIEPDWECITTKVDGKTYLRVKDNGVDITNAIPKGLPILPYFYDGLYNLTAHGWEIDDVANLPPEWDKQLGYSIHVYCNSGDNAAWTGIEWDIFSGAVDLSDYYNKESTENLLKDKQDTANMIQTIGEYREDKYPSEVATQKFVYGLIKEEITDSMTFPSPDIPMASAVVNYVDNKVKTNIINMSDMQTLLCDFSGMYKSEIRAHTIPAISIEFYDGEYEPDYISGLSFISGETPTRFDYSSSGIINWVGTDCTTSLEGYSIFQPSPNTHYDIIFYFNGTQFIGLVNGFVPATGNVVSE